MSRALGLAMLFAVQGCDAPVRFLDRGILWREPDTDPIAVPKPRDALPNWIGVRDAFYLPANRELRLDYLRESVNVNALDEVPDSTWFADPRRVTDESGAVVGQRRFDAGQMERGAMLDDPPPEPPFLVTKGKMEGANLGFQVKDKRGRKYLFKIDPPGLIGMDTATEVVVTRLAWAAGWNVPAETLVDLRASDLELSPKATMKVPPFDEERPLTKERMDKIVRAMPLKPDGTVQAVASRWITGKIVGPFAYFGRRPDDANDRVAHENRRDLRAFAVFSAWVNNIDSLETNTLDSYDGEPGRGHLIHWQQDVGGSFGSRAATPTPWWMGMDIYLAPSRILGSLVTFGALRRPWDAPDVRTRRAELDAAYPELGNFDWERFDPNDWHPVLDNPAFERMTLRDAYWGLKRVLAFDATELRAAISTGHYRPAAEARLFEILWKRREKLARAYLQRLAALDLVRFSRSGALCFEDLWVTNGFGERARYGARGDGVLSVDGDGCVTLATKDGYRVVELTVQRPGERHPEPPLRAHFVEHGGKRRLVGLER